MSDYTSLRGLLYRPWQSFIILTSFILNSCGPLPLAQAQEISLPAPGTMVHLSPEFTPAVLKGIVIHPENAFKFDFIIYKGDKTLTESQKKEEYTKLVKYFLASLAVPDEDQWVNLSPYEKNRIIKDDFGKTTMGRDLLAQDYLLKQITASLIYPQDKLGRKFWDEIYSRAYNEFGTTTIPVNTFNKVWIIPDEADIYEKGNTAYLYKSHLKVMLEEDYLSLEKHSGVIARSAFQRSPHGDEAISERTAKDAHTIASQVIREIVLPQLEKEVNTAKNFAPLRQVFSGMILAAWYKRALRDSLLAKIYANKSKVKGVDQDPKNNEAIYQQYLRAYKKGVFNYIQEDVDKYTNETIPRKYFSGGTALIPEDAAMGSDGMRVAKFLHRDLPDAAMNAVTALNQDSAQAGDDLADVSLDPDQERINNLLNPKTSITDFLYMEMDLLGGPQNASELGKVLIDNGINAVKELEDTTPMELHLYLSRARQGLGDKFIDLIEQALAEHGSSLNESDFLFSFQDTGDLPSGAVQVGQTLYVKMEGTSPSPRSSIGDHRIPYRVVKKPSIAFFLDNERDLIRSKWTYYVIRRALTGGGIDTIDKLAGMSELELRNLRDPNTHMSLGNISIGYLKGVLAKHGLYLRGDGPVPQVPLIVLFLDKHRDLFGSKLAYTLIRHMLIGNGIDTEEKLAGMSELELRNLKDPNTHRSFGNISIGYLKEALARDGFKLKENDHPVGQSLSEDGSILEETPPIVLFLDKHRDFFGSKLAYTIIRHTLTGNGIDTVEKLAGLSEFELKNLRDPITHRGLGNISIGYLKEALARDGFKLKVDDTPAGKSPLRQVGEMDITVGSALTYIEDLMGRSNDIFLNNVGLRRQELRIIQAIEVSNVPAIEPLKERIRFIDWLKNPNNYSTAFSHLNYHAPSLERMINDRGGLLLKDWPKEDRDIFLNQLDDYLENFEKFYFSPRVRLEELLELAPFIVMGWDSLNFYKKGNWPQQADEFVSQLVGATEGYRGKDMLIFRACLILRFPGYFDRAQASIVPNQNSVTDKAMTAEEMLQSMGPNHKTLAQAIEKIKELGVTKDLISGFIEGYASPVYPVKTIKEDTSRITQLMMNLENRKNQTIQDDATAIADLILVIFYKKDGVGRDYKDESSPYINAVYEALKKDTVSTEDLRMSDEDWRDIAFLRGLSKKEKIELQEGIPSGHIEDFQILIPMLNGKYKLSNKKIEEWFEEYKDIFDLKQAIKTMKKLIQQKLSIKDIETDTSLAIININSAKDSNTMKLAVQRWTNSMSFILLTATPEIKSVIKKSAQELLYAVNESEVHLDNHLTAGLIGLSQLSVHSPAMKASPEGGIDLNAANLNLHIKRDGNGVPLPVSQQDLDNIHIDGLVPVILDIKPAGKFLLSL